MNYLIIYYVVILCMQYGDTPLQWAVRNGRHRTVHHFIKEAKMDITQFDMVCY